MAAGPVLRRGLRGTLLHLIAQVLAASAVHHAVHRESADADGRRRSAVDLCRFVCVGLGCLGHLSSIKNLHDLVFGFMWGASRESKISTRESSAKGVRQGQAAKAAPKAGR